MRYTAQEEYGLRCILQLAKHVDQGSITIEEIASYEGMTTHYVGKMMRILLKGGLVESTRGKKGGYTLSRSADTISIEEALAVLGGKIFEKSYCDKYTGAEINCVNSTNCSVRALWSTLNNVVSGILSTTMLSDLVKTEKSVDKNLMINYEENLTV